jgi:Protein of unknown function (DUF2934)
MFMAKRTTPRSTAQDASTLSAPPAQPRPRRPRARTSPESDAIAADSRVEGRENGHGSASAGSSEAGDAAPLESMSVSMASEPSEEDIRNRAYQRFLERGGGHGMDFEDWLEAERELKGRR